MAATSNINSSSHKPATSKAPSASSAASKHSSKNAQNTSDGGKNADKKAPAPPADKKTIFDSSLNAKGSMASNGNSSSGLSSGREQSYSYSRNSGDGYSFSSESKTITTEGTTRLVNSLVDAFSGDSGSAGTASSTSNSSSSVSGSSKSSGSPSGFSPRRNEHESAQAQKQFEHFGLAREQLQTAQQKVDLILNRAVEAKLNKEQPLPEEVVKKAERDQEYLTRAEGRLSRAESQLAESQEFRRQAQGQFELERRSAEDKLLGSFEGLSPQLRRAVLKKFRPRINRDQALRNDFGRLEEEAKTFLKTDTEACRLVQENRLSRTQNDQDKPIGLPAGAALDLEREHCKKVADSDFRKATEESASIQVGSAQSRRLEVIDRLQRRKEERRNLDAPSEEVLGKAIERIDDEATRKTESALEDLDSNSLGSSLDLQRKLGRSSLEVKDDLERVVSRGGAASAGARSVLRRLQDLVERVEGLDPPVEARGERLEPRVGSVNR